MKAHFILLSGGSGSRMKISRPKQFLEMCGKPVILYSAETFANWNSHGNFICVANPEYLKDTEAVLEPIRSRLAGEKRFFNVVPGGSSRQESVRKGMQALSGHTEKNDLLFFHDAARPLLLEEELERLFSSFQENHSIEIASLVSPVSETLIRGNRLPGKMMESLDRNEIFSVKTPQVLRVSSADRLTDDSSEYTDLLTWGEASGILGHLVESDSSNIKLTNPSDLEVLESILEKRRKNS